MPRLDHLESPNKHKNKWERYFVPINRAPSVLSKVVAIMTIAGKKTSKEIVEVPVPHTPTYILITRLVIHSSFRGHVYPTLLMAIGAKELCGMRSSRCCARKWFTRWANLPASDL